MKDQIKKYFFQLVELWYQLQTIDSVALEVRRENGRRYLSRKAL